MCLYHNRIERHCIEVGLTVDEEREWDSDDANVDVDALSESGEESDKHDSDDICFYSGIEGVPLTHTGFTMYSLDKGNPTLKLDAPGQTWLLSAWGMNRYKGGMSPDELYEHMNYLCKNYELDAADAAYESYDEGKMLKLPKLQDCLL